jgi:hypothetical protein
VNHPDLFAVGLIALLLGLSLSLGFVAAIVFLLRPSLREDSPLWLLGCTAPFAIPFGVVLALFGLFWTFASFSDNLGR